MLGQRERKSLLNNDLYKDKELNLLSAFYKKTLMKHQRARKQPYQGCGKPTLIKSDQLEIERPFSIANIQAADQLPHLPIFNYYFV